MAAGDDVVTDTAVDDIVAFATHDQIRTAATVDDVAAIGEQFRIRIERRPAIADGADQSQKDIFIIGPRIFRIATAQTNHETHTTGQRPVGRRSTDPAVQIPCRPGHFDDEIVAVTTVDDVAARPAVDDVDTAATIDGIGAETRVERFGLVSSLKNAVDVGDFRRHIAVPLCPRRWEHTNFPI
ncbi:hypothetical protein XAUB_03810 [Xanthomonas citri pv. aurantifolii str. ICPB 11122]|nr:hypothetical protein XAUB_03810 [Xanthomonas citri pv. aurantifolii str. ICPB 11122]